jgi:predicted ArsR family transcriptional regulator
MTSNSLKHIPNITDLIILSCIANGLKTATAISRETDSTKTRVWNSVAFLAEIGLIDMTNVSQETKNDSINGRSATEFILTRKGKTVIENTVIDFQKNYLVSNKK